MVRLLQWPSGELHLPLALILWRWPFATNVSISPSHPATWPNIPFLWSLQHRRLCDAYAERGWSPIASACRDANGSAGIEGEERQQPRGQPSCIKLQVPFNRQANIPLSQVFRCHRRPSPYSPPPSHDDASFHFKEALKTRCRAPTASVIQRAALWRPTWMRKNSAQPPRSTEAPRAHRLAPVARRTSVTPSHPLCRASRTILTRRSIPVSCPTALGCIRNRSGNICHRRSASGRRQGKSFRWDAARRCWAKCGGMEVSLEWIRVASRTICSMETFTKTARSKLWTILQSVTMPGRWGTRSSWSSWKTTMLGHLSLGWSAGGSILVEWAGMWSRPCPSDTVRAFVPVAYP